MIKFELLDRWKNRDKKNNRQVIIFIRILCIAKKSSLESSRMVDCSYLWCFYIFSLRNCQDCFMLRLVQKETSIPRWWTQCLEREKWYYFFYKFWRTPLTPPFRTTSLGFKARVDSLIFIWQRHMWDSPLVRHPPTFWRSAWQPIAEVECRIRSGDLPHMGQTC